MNRWKILVGAAIVAASSTMGGCILHAEGLTVLDRDPTPTNIDPFRFRTPVPPKKLLEISPGGRLCGPAKVYGEGGRVMLNVPADTCVGN